MTSKEYFQEYKNKVTGRKRNSVIAEVRYYEDCEMLHGWLVLSPKALMFINGQYMEIVIRKVVDNVLAKLDKQQIDVLFTY